MRKSLGLAFIAMLPLLTACWEPALPAEDVVGEFKWDVPLLEGTFFEEFHQSDRLICYGASSTLKGPTLDHKPTEITQLVYSCDWPGLKLRQERLPTQVRPESAAKSVYQFENPGELRGEEPTDQGACGFTIFDDPRLVCDFELPMGAKLVPGGFQRDFTLKTYTVAYRGRELKCTQAVHINPHGSFNYSTRSLQCDFPALYREEGRLTKSVDFPRVDTFTVPTGEGKDLTCLLAPIGIDCDWYGYDGRVKPSFSGEEG